MPTKSDSAVDVDQAPHFLNTFRHLFNQSESAKIRDLAQSQNVTLNDLLLRDLFIALNQWSKSHGLNNSKKWLRIAVPVSLRTGENYLMPAANCVSYNFITRNNCQCADAETLLKGICKETGVATRNRRALLFLRGFKLMERTPGAIPIYMGMNRCFATVVLSNLGNVCRHFGASFPRESGKIVAGNVTLEDIFAAPPVRPNTHAAFVVGNYAERLWICVRHAPKPFPADNARRLLLQFVGKTTEKTEICTDLR